MITRLVTAAIAIAITIAIHGLEYIFENLQ